MPSPAAGVNHLDIINADPKTVPGPTISATDNAASLSLFFSNEQLNQPTKLTDNSISVIPPRT